MGLGSVLPEVTPNFGMMLCLSGAWQRVPAVPPSLAASSSRTWSSGRRTWSTSCAASSTSQVKQRPGSCCLRFSPWGFTSGIPEAQSSSSRVIACPSLGFGSAEKDWTEEDRVREQVLMQELVTIIEQRNAIVNCLDEDRQR